MNDKTDWDASKHTDALDDMERAIAKRKAAQGNQTTFNSKAHINNDKDIDWLKKLDAFVEKLKEPVKRTLVRIHVAGKESTPKFWKDLEAIVSPQSDPRGRGTLVLTGIIIETDKAIPSGMVLYVFSDGKQELKDWK